MRTWVSRSLTSLRMPARVLADGKELAWMLACIGCIMTCH